MKRASIVIGLGFGDEGKGMLTDYLCSQYSEAIVIRFSGGHQAGHTVHLPDGTHHVFSSFGSGTLRGVPTFWSRYCTFYPVGLINEYEALREKGNDPVLFLDPEAMVTTPYDIAWNRALEKVNQHGSVGVGFGATIARNETPYRLKALELHYPFVFREKMKAVSQYYDQKIKERESTFLAEAYQQYINQISLDEFEGCVELSRSYTQIRNEREVFLKYNHGIFEGSQGILLDMDHGFFPHVTHSRTTSANAMEMIHRHSDLIPEIYYISRAYQSRHGNGPMTHEGLSLRLHNTVYETNQTHDWQGNFRRTILDADLLHYALQCDGIYADRAKKHLVISCLDQIAGEWQVSRGGELFSVKTAVGLAALLEGQQFDGIYENRSVEGDLQFISPLLLTL